MAAVTYRTNKKRERASGSFPVHFQRHHSFKTTNRRRRK